MSGPGPTPPVVEIIDLLIKFAEAKAKLDAARDQELKDQLERKKERERLLYEQYKKLKEQYDLEEAELARQDAESRYYQRRRLQLEYERQRENEDQEKYQPGAGGPYDGGAPGPDSRPVDPGGGTGSDGPSSSSGGGGGEGGPGGGEGLVPAAPCLVLGEISGAHKEMLARLRVVIP
jgi:hypothetical protein